MAERDVEYDAFFAKHWTATVRALTVMTSNPQLAADASQEAFVKAYARWSRVRRLESPAAWVRKVAMNAARDMARSDGRRRQREERTAVPDWVAPVSTPGLDPDLADALAALPDRQRTAVALHYVADMSVRDVAEAMGISEGAVKFNLHQGRERLGSVLGVAR